MQNRLTRRQFLQTLSVAAVGTTLIVACAPPAQQQAAAGGESAPAKAKTVIAHWAQTAEPSDPKQELPAGAKPKVAYQKVADEYMAAHPDIGIEWYRFPSGGNLDEWLLARMTAQDAPDIYWANTESLWPHVNKGWALVFDDYMNLPNPYVQGNDQWKNQFEEIAVISQTGPDGHLYGVNMDGAGVLTVYNKQAFADAGITQEPKTWTEFMAANQKLLDKGYIPYGADFSPDTCCFPHWFEAHVYNQLLWDDIWQFDDDKNKVITARELTAHAQKGDFPEWESYLQLAHMLKSMTPYFPIGYEGKLDYRQLFRQGKVAMYMEGNWAISDFTNSPPPFEISWMAFPVVTSDIWPKAQNKVVRIQGAWGAMQYHIPGYLAQKDSGKIAHIMDWLMYSSKPENVTAVCAETSLVPLTKGATARPELAPFSQPYDRAVPYQSWATLSSSALNAEYSNWQAYLPSEMSDSDFLAMAKKSWDEEVKKILEANPDWKI
jgi:ABC-type glycerol-3-phosphate transport system substrate-binding protein